MPPKPIEVEPSAVPDLIADHVSVCLNCGAMDDHQYYFPATCPTCGSVGVVTGIERAIELGAVKVAMLYSA